MIYLNTKTETQLGDSQQTWQIQMVCINFGPEVTTLTYDYVKPK